MAANFLHGVETVEILKGPRPIRQVKTAVVGLIGTAPTGPLNTPTIVLSERDAAAFGEAQYASGYTIPQALDAIFDQGAGTVIVINVCNPATHKQAVTNETVTLDAVTGVGKLAKTYVSAVVVKSEDLATPYVLDTDYTLDAAAGTITRKPGGAIASGATLKVSYEHVAPNLVTSSDIIGTVTAGGDRTGIKALDDTYNRFGFNAKLILAPVYGTLTAVSTELIAMAHKLRGMAIIDAPIGVTVQQAVEGRGPAGSINFNTSSERAILCYPHLKVFDAATGAERLEPMSQRLAGVICRKDADNGYWWSPSNTEIMGITGVERPITGRINDPQSEANLLNENGIVTVFNSFGTGLRAWGNRSAAWPSMTHPRNFINVRRTADVLHESVEYSMLQFIDAPIDDGLIDAVKESVNGFIRTLIARGALIDGACTYDPAKNPPTEIALGHLTFDVTFMPPTPAERITFESFIDIGLLAKLGSQQ
ncbi:phage tail sheath subtilisin-like domain-containing protein [Caldimonas manganoxidans]|uniref:phage tail sheath subtilisin-like domain-containing protein n=1 Tax=Caldimonas manganoxidans TaxID=196015 RepID=UPI0003602BA0|nr:phage tail sheath subtilisin-like domain-containing protein [Caldimonas manganoxidans]